MSNKELKVFNWKKGIELRSMLIEDEPWFVAKDVAVALGYKNPRDAISKHVDELDVAKRDTKNNGVTRTLTYINESGVWGFVQNGHYLR